MATDKQIAANRRNALRSTGPTTDEGRQRSSRNALIHGITAKRLLIDGEDPQDYADLKKGIWAEFEIETTLEEEVGNRLVNALFRLRRVPVFEAALIEWLDRMNACMHDDNEVEFPVRSANAVDHPGEDATLDERLSYGNQRLGRTLETMFKKGDMLGRVAGYEQRLVRQAREAVQELRQLIGERVRLEEKAEQGLNEPAK